jgi:hypothetical protein
VEDQYGLDAAVGQEQVVIKLREPVAVFHREMIFGRPPPGNAACRTDRDG